MQMTNCTRDDTASLLE